MHVLDACVECAYCMHVSCACCMCVCCMCVCCIMCVLYVCVLYVCMCTVTGERAEAAVLKLLTAVLINQTIHLRQGNIRVE